MQMREMPHAVNFFGAAETSTSCKLMVNKSKHFGRFQAEAGFNRSQGHAARGCFSGINHSGFHAFDPESCSRFPFHRLSQLRRGSGKNAHEVVVEDVGAGTFHLPRPNPPQTSGRSVSPMMSG